MSQRPWQFWIPLPCPWFPCWILSSSLSFLSSGLLRISVVVLLPLWLGQSDPVFTRPYLGSLGQSVLIWDSRVRTLGKLVHRPFHEGLSKAPHSHPNAAVWCRPLWSGLPALHVAWVSTSHSKALPHPSQSCGYQLSVGGLLCGATLQASRGRSSLFNRTLALTFLCHLGQVTSHENSVSLSIKAHLCGCGRNQINNIC